MEKADQAYENSVLPEEADREIVEKLLMSITGDKVIIDMGG